MRQLARGFFTKICLSKAWRQDGVVDASLGVVHASLDTSHTRDPRAGSGCLLVSYMPLGAAPAGSLFQALL